MNTERWLQLIKDCLNDPKKYWETNSRDKKLTVAFALGAYVDRFGQDPWKDFFIELDDNQREAVNTWRWKERKGTLKEEDPLYYQKEYDFRQYLQKPQPEED